jgi:uncharacterized membrane protein
MADSTGHHGSPRPPRIQFIDLLRGWAVIVMVQTHVFNATARPEILASPLFDVIRFIDGLVAPSFLFASGMAYAVTTRRKIADYLTFGRPLLRQFGRLLLILGIGYLLHVPRFEFHHVMYVAGEEAWLRFFQADVLHCIAVSLLVLQVLLLILRSERLLYRAAAVLALGIVAVTPVVWGIDFLSILPAPVAAYMNGLHYSLFPLFPWAAFLLLGAVTGHLFMNARARAEEGAERHFMRGLAAAAVGVLLLSLASAPFERLLYPVYNYWRTGPSFVFLRLALVALILYGLFLYEKRRGVSARSLVTLAGRESLLVYVAHLMLIYGQFVGPSLAERTRGTFGYLESSAFTVALVALMFGAALGWERLKKGPPRIKQGIQTAFVVALVLVFFFHRGA